MTLLNYDKENNTDYYETLQAYLLNRQNLNETANQLFIHRNTIKYRLNKINELSKIDLTNGETVFQLAYSYKILHYVRKRGVL
ncbi:helix-turn-helix domain-containing protein [Bacillus sp. JJ1764]|uniref:PucR family transcriptional regulator n=1 Tax=Bacillus sp. JJ1764 TaxID=3122964 RepID=UPI003F68ACBD